MARERKSRIQATILMANTMPRVQDQSMTFRLDDRGRRFICIKGGAPWLWWKDRWQYVMGRKLYDPATLSQQLQRLAPQLKPR